MFSYCFHVTWALHSQELIINNFLSCFLPPLLSTPVSQVCVHQLSVPAHLWVFLTHCHAGAHSTQIPLTHLFYYLLSQSFHRGTLDWNSTGLWWYFALLRGAEQGERGSGTCTTCQHLSCHCQEDRLKSCEKIKNKNVEEKGNIRWLFIYCHLPHSSTIPLCFLP